MPNSNIRCGESQAQPLVAVEQVFAAAQRMNYPLRMVIAHSEATAKRAGKRAKTPVEYRWNRINPSIDDCRAALNAGYLLGVVPASVKMTVVDVDSGDPALIKTAAPPIASFPSHSGKPGREHLWYSAGAKPVNIPRRHLVMDENKLRVDVIHSHPYALTHHYLHLLALIIGGGNAGDGGDGDFPHDLFPATLKPSAPADAVNMQRYWNARRHIDLRKVEMGKRNNALFMVCCWFGQVGAEEYRVGRIKTMADLLTRAVLWNAEMPVPLSLEEVECIVKSAWKYLRRDGGIGPREKEWNWTWDSDNQSRRQVKRWRAHNAKRSPLKERAFQLDAEGKSSAQIARKIRVPASTVRRWLGAKQSPIICYPPIP